MLENDNEAPESGENPANEHNAEISELKSELENIKLMNAQLMGKLDILTTKQVEAPKSKQYTEAEFKKLWEDNPQEALNYSIESIVESKLSSKVKPTIDSVLTKTQKEKWDDKAEKDFPFFNDKEFNNLIKEELSELLDSGLSKDSPKLLYTAAKMATARYSKKPESRSKNSMTGEAPSNVSREKNRSLPNEDALMKIFGITSKDSQDRFKKKMEERNKQETGRRNR